MIRRLRVFLRDNPLMRRFLYPVARWFMIDVLNYRQIVMRLYGYDAVAKIQIASENVGISCYPMYGTLLGFVRDGGFIAHDNDIDFMICEEPLLEKFYRALLDEGFTFSRYILFDGRFKEFSMRYKECSIDFFGRGEFVGDDIFKARTENYGEFWGSLEVPSPKNPQPFYVHGVRTVLPENYDEILRQNYGDYTKKVKSWNSTMAPAFRKDNDSHEVLLSREVSSWEAWLRSCKNA